MTSRSVRISLARTRTRAAAVGRERWTTDITKAKRFASQEDAMGCWRKQSTVKPFRSDGRPNRPMTAYSVVVEELTAERGVTILSAG